MKIKDGYGEKEMNVKIGSSNVIGRYAELWIEFGVEPKKETLSYLSLNELMDLKEEIQKAINQITGC